MTTLALRGRRATLPLPLVLAAAVALWLVAWLVESPAAGWLAFDVLGLEHGSHLGESVAFFLEDLPKVLLLLTGIVTVVTLIRGFFPPERVRPMLVGRGEVPGTLAAAGIGIVTPFCSCSAVPLFIGFVEAGVPLGVTFAFLISSPMVNEVALVLLWGLFGPGIALAYMAAGLTVAVAGGLVIGRLKLERYVEDYVWELGKRGNLAPGVILQPSWSERLTEAWAYTRDLVRKLLPYLVAGIGIGALIHGYAPTDLVAAIGGRGNPFAVLIVVALAVPMYSNAAGTIPIVQALLGKGMPLGTTLAFMMGVTALSLPEFVSDPNAETLAGLAAQFPNIEVCVGDNCAAAGQQLVFLGLHPAAFAEALPGFAAAVRADAVVVSLAPKVTIEKLAAMLGGFDRIARANPNAPSIVGAGYNPVAFGAGLDEAARAMILELFAPLGESPVVDESTIEAYAVTSAMGPTYLWFQLYGLRELATSFGLTDEAAAEAVDRMLRGALDTMASSGLTPAQVMDLVPVRPLGEVEPAFLDAYRTRLPAVMDRIRPA